MTNKQTEERKQLLASTTSSFPELVGDNCYVDKTKYIYKLVRFPSKKAYFLSRPRRFGKSLLISTLAALFSNKEELFRGLYLHDKWDWSTESPVITLNLSVVEGESTEDIRYRLLYILSSCAKFKYQLTLNQTDPSLAFSDLIQELYVKYNNKKVVILIDEYDYPILNNILVQNNAENARKELASFFHVIKQMDEYIRFTFITGVSRFSKVSIFSKLNNLYDLSLDPEFSAICGYTQQELDDYFAPLLNQFDRDEFRQYYNGYNWLGESVYNPIDTEMALTRGTFGNYWYETGTPTFLKELLQKRGPFAPAINAKNASSTILDGISIHSVDDNALLFQTGYLTIAESFYDDIAKIQQFRLKFPNDEVRYAYLRALFTAWIPDATYSDYAHRFNDIETALASGDIRAIGENIANLFASFSHHFYQYEGNAMEHYEAFYTAVVAGTLSGVADDITMESNTPRGRIDLYARKGHLHYIFEMKMSDSKGARKGVEQIIARGYAEKYRRTGRQLFLIGIDFNSEKRNVDAIYYQMDGETELREVITFT